MEQNVTHKRENENDNENENEHSNNTDCASEFMMRSRYIGVTY